MKKYKQKKKIEINKMQINPTIQHKKYWCIELQNEKKCKKIVVEGCQKR